MAKKTNTELPIKEDVVLKEDITSLTVEDLQTLMNQIAGELKTEADKSKLAFFYELKKERNEKLAEVAN